MFFATTFVVNKVVRVINSPNRHLLTHVLQVPFNEHGEVLTKCPSI